MIQDRVECKHCGNRIYPDWRHHGSNMKPCYGGLDSEAEPRDSSSISTEPVWAVLYDDPERPYQVFTGQDAELAAKAFYEKEQARWTCHLMRNAAKGQSNGR